jgi:hypothetical protein
MHDSPSMAWLMFSMNALNVAPLRLRHAVQ